MRLAAIAVTSACLAMGVLAASAAREDPGEVLRDSMLVRYAIVLVDQSRPTGEPLDLREMAETLPYSLVAPAIGGAFVEYSAFPVVGLMVGDEARMQLPSSPGQRDVLAAVLGVDGSFDEIAVRVSVERSVRAESVALATALVLDVVPQGETRGSADDGHELFRVKAESLIPGTSLFVIPAGDQRQWVIVAESRWVRQIGPPAKGIGLPPRR